MGSSPVKFVPLPFGYSARESWVATVVTLETNSRHDIVFPGHSRTHRGRNPSRQSTWKAGFRQTDHLCGGFLSEMLQTHSGEQMADWFLTERFS